MTSKRQLHGRLLKFYSSWLWENVKFTYQREYYAHIWFNMEMPLQILTSEIFTHLLPYTKLVTSELSYYNGENEDNAFQLKKKIVAMFLRAMGKETSSMIKNVISARD